MKEVLVLAPSSSCDGSCPSAFPQSRTHNKTFQKDHKMQEGGIQRWDPRKKSQQRVHHCLRQRACEWPWPMRIQVARKLTLKDRLRYSIINAPTPLGKRKWTVLSEDRLGSSKLLQLPGRTPSSRRERKQAAYGETVYSAELKLKVSQERGCTKPQELALPQFKTLSKRDVHGSDLHGK